MELKPGYKQTEVGVIPEEWEVHTIGQTMRLLNGRAFKPDDWRQQGIPIIRIQNLNDRAGAFNYCDTPIEEKHLVAVGDVLFAWSGTTGTSFGARIWDGPTGVLNQHIFKVIADAKKLTPFYSFLILQRVQGDIEKQAHGFKASFVHVKKSDLVKVFLPVPPLPEQHAIEGALSDVDALISALESALAKKRDLKQATMQQLLTGQIRLPGFTGEWEVKRFADVAFPRRDRVDPRRTGVHEFCVELEHIESASGVLLGSTSTGDQSSLKSVFCSGDVLFGKLRAYLRKYWLATRSGVCSTEIWVFVPNGRLITTAYLFQLIKTDQFIEAASNAYGTHMPRSDWNIVKNYEMQLPPLPEQTAIAEVLSDMDTELAALEQRRDKTRSLKQGMMQELLTGRTRLV